MALPRPCTKPSILPRSRLPRSRRAGGGGRIRTYEDVRRQIYSLLPLTARQPLRIACRPAQRNAAHKMSGLTLSIQARRYTAGDTAGPKPARAESPVLQRWRRCAWRKSGRKPSGAESLALWPARRGGGPRQPGAALAPSRRPRRPRGGGSRSCRRRTGGAARQRSGDVRARSKRLCGDPAAPRRSPGARARSRTAPRARLGGCAAHRPGIGTVRSSSSSIS